MQLVKNVKQSKTGKVGAFPYFPGCSNYQNDIMGQELPRTPLLVESFLVGETGLEPATSAMSKQCSNQLSYPPVRQILYRGKDDLTMDI